MRYLSPRIFNHTWILTLLLAAGFLLWADYSRMQRAVYVTNTDRGADVVDATSPTGYVDGKRWFIVPESNDRSYRWIAETQQMFRRGEWRVRHIDYENPPGGRAVFTPSPYRWWLGLIAWCDNAFSGRSLALAVEQAALWADPLLHLLLLLSATIFVGRQFGTIPGTLVALGIATLYPLAGRFLPSGPDDRGLVCAVIMWSMLPLLAGVGKWSELNSTPNPQGDAPENTRALRRVRRLFLISGVIGGTGLWIAAQQQALVMTGVTMSGLIAAWLASREATDKSGNRLPGLPWRTWAVAGAVTSTAAYLVEYFPSHLGMRLEFNHPLYGLAWIGAGELLIRIEGWFRQRRGFGNVRQTTALFLALAAMAALPTAMVLSDNQTFLDPNPADYRLSFLPNGPVAKSLPDWIARDGFTATVAATCLPLLLLIPGLVTLMRCPAKAVGFLVALGPAAVVFAVACSRLAWWSLFDAMLLALAAATAADFMNSANPAPRRWLWSGLALLAFLPGMIQLLPSTSKGDEIAFTPGEVEALIERSIAHWIADQAGPDGTTILAPPNRTTRLCFHGGLRGLGTTERENSDGLLATVRIVTATTGPEAQNLLTEHGVTHLLLPSWDNELEVFARQVVTNPEDAFISALNHWALPSWLRPLPYKLPAVPGWENRSVVILRVTDETNKVAALARLAEYFVETFQPEYAGTVGEALRQFPADLNALIALAHIERARGNIDAYDTTIETLQTSVEGGFDRGLPWDRRVSLAIVLALGEHHDLAREQVQQCLSRIDATRIRSLTTGELFRLQALGKAYNLPIADPALRDLARNLVPEELRSRL